MYLINKANSRRTSRELTSEEFVDNNDNMDFSMYTAPYTDKPKTDKKSRLRTSSFFGKRRSCEISPDDLANFRSPSRANTIDNRTDASSFSLAGKRRLRKVSSKASLMTMPNPPTHESFAEEKTSRRFLPDIWKSGPWGQSNSSSARKPISAPFNFSHITHKNTHHVGQLRQTNPEDLLRDWNRVVRESTGSLGAQSNSTDETPPSSSHRLSNSSRNLGVRSRANSARTLSPRESLVDLAASGSSENLRSSAPLTPPPRSSPTQFLRSLPESPSEDGTLVGDERDFGNEELVDQIFYPDYEAPHAISTVGECSYGRKSPGIEKLAISHSIPEESEDGDHRPDTPLAASIPELRETQSTPDFMPPRANGFLSVTRARPISQISQMSDTLNGNFSIPPSPLFRSSSKRRISRRITPAAGAGLDSWEEDIDWCYEHEADADCNFDWEKGSEYDESFNGGDDETVVNPISPSSLSLNESATLNNENLKVPEEVKDEIVVVEKRITGLFEDRLLLPPSPQFPPSPGFRDHFDSHFDTFDSFNNDDESIIFRAASTALRHRSINSASSLDDFIVGRNYRDELARVAQQLDEHIAALNQDMYRSPLRIQYEKPLYLQTSSVFSGKRARADSEATCVTLCSDTETITPTDTIEAITPSGSARSSFYFTKPRSSSVMGIGVAVEGRTVKGLSIPAAAIPGVIEFGPDGSHNFLFEEQEFVHFI
ncbi:hypothetical protein RUND412_005443 [Rhizina undulata]